MGRTRLLAMIGAATFATGAALGTPSAFAESGYAWSTTRNALADFWDLHDKVTVCDAAGGNTANAIGIISVQPANGAFKERGRLVDYSADGHCVGKNFDVLREKSALRVTACDIRRGDILEHTCRTLQLAG